MWAFSTPTISFWLGSCLAYLRAVLLSWACAAKLAPCSSNKRTMCLFPFFTPWKRDHSLLLYFSCFRTAPSSYLNHTISRYPEHRPSKCGTRQCSPKSLHKSEDVCPLFSPLWAPSHHYFGAGWWKLREVWAVQLYICVPVWTEQTAVILKSTTDEKVQFNSHSHCWWTYLLTRVHQGSHAVLLTRIHICTTDNEQLQDVIVPCHRVELFFKQEVCGSFSSQTK